MSDASKFKTEQEAFWAGSFGKDYIGRNQGARLLASNVALFSRALRAVAPPRTCLEFGANIGMNLRALKVLFPDLDARAIEINMDAVGELVKVIDEGNVYHGSILDYPGGDPVDLALIKGVLIHQDPAVLPQVYDALHAATGRYLFVMEYYNPTPVALPYRGHEDKLFKRDFAGEIMDRFSDLELLDYGFCYRRDQAFPQDDMTWFIMEKHS